jgi:hypothetical protein
LGNIGLPERRIIEVEPLVIPVPGELPDWLDPIKEPEPVVPEREPLVPA